jgi:tripartite-type tricarboxylate transporter receptor subunit TctC
MAAAKQPDIVERLNQLAIVPFGTTRVEFQKAIEQTKVINRESIKAAGLPTIN